MQYPISFSAFVSRLAIGAVCLSFSALSASAASVFWDTDGNAAAGYGGTGTWDTTTANWNTNEGGTGALQTWVAGDAANFGGSGGVVTVGSGISTTGINFRGGTYNYTLSGADITMTTPSFGGVIGTNSGLTADISISNNIFLTDANGTSNSTYNLGAQGSTNITLSGNLTITGATAATNTLAFNLFSNSTFTYSGSTNAASRVAFQIGGTGTSNSARVTLSGANSPIAATVVNKGILVLDHNTAAGTQGITLANANTNATNDSAVLLIGAGRSINNAITVSTNSADTSTAEVRRIGGEFTSGSASFTGALSVAAQKQATGLEITAAGTSRISFTGSITGAGLITKVGTGTVVFSRPSSGTTHSGGIVVAEGTLLANGFNSTGSSVVTVNSGATLGGTGTINGATTANSGAFLSAGDATVASGVGTLTFGGALDISGLASGTGGLLFDIGATADRVALTAGALSIGTGALNFNDFTFTSVVGFDVGTYTLFDTSTSIVGTLGSSLTGTINGLDATISLANAGQDIVLTVTAIPEPSTYAAFAGALVLAGAAYRRRSQLCSR
jgi:autotransporter-associated beta strand protein